MDLEVPGPASLSSRAPAPRFRPFHFVGAAFLDELIYKLDHVVDVDLGENLPVTAGVLKVNGTLAAYASMRVPEPVFPHYTLMRVNANIRLVFVYTMPDEAKRSACADIVRACEEGRLIHPVGPRFSLDDVAAAHEVIESGNFIGNVVVDIG